MKRLSTYDINRMVTLINQQDILINGQMAAINQKDLLIKRLSNMNVFQFWRWKHGLKHLGLPKFQIPPPPKKLNHDHSRTI